MMEKPTKIFSTHAKRICIESDIGREEKTCRHPQTTRAISLSLSDAYIEALRIILVEQASGSDLILSS